MLPFVVVGSCIVILVLIMAVVVHSTGITIFDVPHLDISMAFSMDCSCPFNVVPSRVYQQDYVLATLIKTAYQHYDCPTR